MNTGRRPKLEPHTAANRIAATRRKAFFVWLARRASSSNIRDSLCATRAGARTHDSGRMFGQPLILGTERIPTVWYTTLFSVLLMFAVNYGKAKLCAYKVLRGNEAGTRNGEAMRRSRQRLQNKRRGRHENRRLHLAQTAAAGLVPGATEPSTCGHGRASQAGLL